jgi:hypothetical protein
MNFLSKLKFPLVPLILTASLSATTISANEKIKNDCQRIIFDWGEISTLVNWSWFVWDFKVNINWNNLLEVYIPNSDSDFSLSKINDLWNGDCTPGVLVSINKWIDKS